LFEKSKIDHIISYHRFNYILVFIIDTYYGYRYPYQQPIVNMYTFLNYFFTVFHGSLILFILMGWVSRKTRRLHLMTMVLTLLSWFGLGIFYGWGYCPSTDWHWQVKQTLGETNLPNSYIKYAADKLTGSVWDPSVIDVMVLSAGLLALALSSWLNWRDWHSDRFPQQ
jgi:hypothetical protein